MRTLYSVIFFFIKCGGRIIALFSPTMRTAFKGRAFLDDEIQYQYAVINPDRKRIVIHSSSFGELEQAKPVIALLRERMPNVHIHVTFFSPSGYENAVSRYTEPDLITYLPFDSRKDVKAFLDVVKPAMFIFTRYDLWYNLVNELSSRHIPSFVISATYSDTIWKRLPLVRAYFRQMYASMKRIYTTSPKQSRRFEELLESVDTIVTTGDTRIDQTLERKTGSLDAMVLSLEFFEQEFFNERITLVAGSTWYEDEVLLEKLYRKYGDKFTLFIAPHTVDEKHLSQIESLFGNAIIRMSRIKDYSGQSVILWDSMGTLFELYLYADVSYVGGGFGAGVHNVLEPAVYFHSVICGPNHQRSAEVAELASLGVLSIVSNADELISVMEKFINFESTPIETTDILIKYFEERKGAADRITEELLFYLRQSYEFS